MVFEIKFIEITAETNGVRNGFHHSSHINGFKRNHSDGSDRDNEYDDEYLDDLSDRNPNSNCPIGDDLDDYNDHNQEDLIMPRVYVQNKPIPLDKINPKLIDLMNENEKDSYISMCRELYSVIYEI